MRKLLILSLFTIILSSIYLIRFYTHQSIENFEAKISTARLLIKNGKQTIALYDSSYTVFKHKSNTMKSIKYSYVVAGEKYDDKKQFSVLPEEKTFLISYLPDNPIVHSQNPQEDLLNFQKALEKDKNESPLFAWIIITIAMGFAFLLIRNKKKEAENAKYMQELSKQYQ